MKASLLHMIHAALSSLQTQETVKLGSSARREEIIQCYVGPSHSHLLAQIECDYMDSDLTSRIVFQHSCSDHHCDQTLLKCKIHIVFFTPYKRSAPFQKTQRALLKICPLSKHFSPPDYVKPRTFWLGIVPVDLTVFFNESRPMKNTPDLALSLSSWLTLLEDQWKHPVRNGPGFLNCVRLCCYLWCTVFILFEQTELYLRASMPNHVVP